MTNIRDQCSWVHRDDPVAATEKAIDLMRMAVGRARHLKALDTGQLPVTQSALVLGGGLAGMTAALALADQGFPVHLVEKEAVLGGHCATSASPSKARTLRASWPTLCQVKTHPKITVHRRTKPVQITGHVGNFKTASKRPAREDARSRRDRARHRRQERATEAYLYGKNPARDHPAPTGRQAGPGQPAPGRREPPGGDDPVRGQPQRQASLLQPRVLFRGRQERARTEAAEAQAPRWSCSTKDIRTYGFRESSYQKAREAGVLFVRFAEGQDPQVSDAGGLQVSVTDAGTGRELEPQARPAGAVDRHRPGAPTIP